MTFINAEHETSGQSAGSRASRLGPEELARAVRAADPAAILVVPRILRRVIKQHRDLGGFAYRVPHRKSYVIDRDALLRIADHSELGIGEYDTLPQRVILIARSSRRKAAAMPAEAALLRCWRLLFHARVHLMLEEQAAAGKLTVPEVRRRRVRLGPTEFEEIRNVLRQEGMLLPPQVGRPFQAVTDDASAGDRNVYIEFAATYLELRHFAPSFLARYFPGLEDLAAVDRLLAEDVDAEGMLQATRPAGAPEPSDDAALDGDEGLPPDGDAPSCGPLPAARPSEVRYRWMLRRAQRPAAAGNVVGAAIYRARAARYAPPEAATKTQAAVRTDIAHLVDRLRSALGIRDENFHAWQDALLALAAQTPRGIWTAEARLLYDLQKACVDHERDLYTVGVVEWGLSLGRRPLKRPLPNQREVLLCKHLRSAIRRLPAVRIAEDKRRQLERLLRAATERVETQVRERLRPLVTGVLDRVGLLPHSAVERVSRKKLVEELLDHVVERGYLTFGDLRDAISRNHVKLSDVSGPRDLWFGDALLWADRLLAVALDGVYRRGEIYMRWMQRFSSLGFGTRLGRFLTKYLAVPFGGAAVTGVFLDYIAAEITRAPKKKGAILHVFSGDAFWTITCLLGVFLFGLMHAHWFRRLVGRAFTGAWRVLRWSLFDPLVWFARSLVVQRILRSRWFLFAWRFVIEPGLLAALAWWALPRSAIRHWPTETAAGVSLFLAANLLLNSRVGRNLQEMAVDSLVQGWHNYGARMLAGAFHAVVDFFRAILEWTERGLYTVDEWLRFKSGEGRLALAGKAALSLVWFWVTYLVRFTINVLVEPQINPIKHFPVVTVSHKVLLAAYIPFAHFLENLLNIRFAEAMVVAMTIIWCIPGIFGFLAWELRENWRLYVANRAKRLRRAIIGSHGEGMPRLLRPGFHSGTIPKRFAKLRKAERKARENGRWKTARKQLDALHHLQRDVRRYVEREFAAWFAESRAWQGEAPAVAEIVLSTNRVRVALTCPAVADGALCLTFETQSGWLLAGLKPEAQARDAPDYPSLARRASMDGGLKPEAQARDAPDYPSPARRASITCAADRQAVLCNALLGLYKTAAVDLVRQQVEAEFRTPVASYHCDRLGLVLWPDESLATEVRYNLRQDGSLAAPEVSAGDETERTGAGAGFPAFDRTRLVFRETDIPWEAWVAAWEAEQTGDKPVSPVIAVRVLPSG